MDTAVMERHFASAEHGETVTTARRRAPTDVRRYMSAERRDFYRRLQENKQNTFSARYEQVASGKR